MHIGLQNRGDDFNARKITLDEIAFPIWLLIKGVDVECQSQHVPAAV